MTRLANAPVFKWLLVLVSLVPAAFFAYLGHFSRLMGDDYSYFSTVLRLGFRDNFGHWWNNWHGSYTFIVAYDVLAPLGPQYFPPLMPTVIIVTFTIGLAWIISHVLRGLELRQDKLLIAIGVAGLGAFATVISFHTGESFYHFTASLRHTLPVGVLLVFVGLALELADRIRSKTQTLLAASGYALLCFVIAGLSELSAVIQIASFLLVISCMGVVMGRPFYTTRFVLFAAGLVGSAVSLLVQLSAPGSAIRVEQTATLEYTNAVHELPSLVARTLESSFMIMGHPGSILGFMLMMVAGVAVTLVICRPKQLQTVDRSLKVAAAPFILGLILHLLLVTSIWMSGSAQPTDLETSKTAITLVRCLQILFIAAFCLVIWRRKQMGAFLNDRKRGASLMSAAVLLAVFALLAAAQHQDLYADASAYLFVSALALLCILGAQLNSRFEDFQTRRLYLAALLTLFCAFIGVTLPIAVGHFTLGYIFERTLAVSSLSQVVVGLVWGAYVGYLIKRTYQSTEPISALFKWITMTGFVVTVAIVIGSVVSPRLGLISDFAAFAREWDARHELIVRLRNSGEREIVVEPYSFDMTAYVSSWGLPMGKISTYYYDLDLVTVSEP